MTRYKELRQILADEIAAGKHAVGGRFPTEFELCDRFGVSRHTVREALRMLQDQGLLSRQAGAGTIVLARTRPTLYSQTLDSLDHLSDYAAETRFECSHEGFVTLRGALAETLGCAPGERWLRFAGLRRALTDDTAICWTEIFVAEPYAAIREQAAKETGSIYKLVVTRFGIEISEVEQRVSALAVPPEIAAALGIDAAAPALLTRRRYYANDAQTPFEITVSVHPGDRYSHTHRLKRGNGAGPS
ncbi:MAG TPA: GntR family transcriptional regulator [Alphaproteobacteria bacterium]|jgi:DNA-binding GntR family transcriptional regulator|nr:GntR family transcriptional regulator [Alphaproteobacteria bacterium]